ncbi:MAG: MFS transporter, partial [Cyanobacteriota bacterium]|nr:MFS transporter [Cyanobacteriota bacterium]
LALRDRRLLVFAIINVLFTIYVSQIHSTIPLYFNNFVNNGFSASQISYLFAGHIALSILFQLPVANFLNRLTRPHALMISSSFWGIGFLLIGITGIVENQHLFFASLALAILAIAIVSYTPSASALVADIAPESLRGIYLAINAQCWAIGYLIGPPLGGWVLDQTPQIVYNYWLGLAASIGVTIAMLQGLNRILNSQKLNY